MKRVCCRFARSLALLTLACLTLCRPVAAQNGYLIQDLGSLGSYYFSTSSLAYGINDQGQVVGESITNSGDYHAFLWDSVQGMQDLGILKGYNGQTNRYTESYAYGINNNGQVVGESTINNGYHAFLWDSVHGMQDLGTLGSYSYAGSYSVAFGINDQGQVVGESITNSGHYEAFLWDSAHGMQGLGSLARIVAPPMNNVLVAVRTSILPMSSIPFFLSSILMAIAFALSLKIQVPQRRSADPLPEAEGMAGGH